MKKIFVWGSGVEIQAASSLFQKEIFEVTDSVIGEARWSHFKPHSIAILSGLNLVEQIVITSTCEWMEIAHICGSHFDSVVPIETSTGDKLSKPELTKESCSGKTFVID